MPKILLVVIFLLTFLFSSNKEILYSATNDCSFLESNITLKTGMVHYSVSKIQKLLNEDPDTQVAFYGAGSPGKETNKYGAATSNAVKHFQEKYAEDILYPLGLSFGTGVIRKSTREKLLDICLSSQSRHNYNYENSIKRTGIPTAINASCGVTNNADLTYLPTSSLCLKGQASGVYGNGPWSWSCYGLFGGTSVNCYANSGQSQTNTSTNNPGVSQPSNIINTKINASCGVTSNITIDSMQNITPCSTGQVSMISGTGPWSWSCFGLYGGSSVNCSVNKRTTSNYYYNTNTQTNTINATNGLCALTGTTSLRTLPSQLCSTGQQSIVTGNGPWSWSCFGLYGGNSVNCLLNSIISTTTLNISTSTNTTTSTSTLNTSTTTQTVATTSTSQITPVISKQKRMIAYYPYWSAYKGDKIPYQSLTHIMHAFIQVSNNATFDVTSNTYVLEPEMIRKAHLSGVKVFASLDAVGWLEKQKFIAISASPTLRSTFATNLTTFLLTNNYDGVDFDWEFPETDIQKINQNLLVEEVRKTFNARAPSFGISMAIAPNDWYGKWSDYTTLNNYVDFYNIMTYEFSGSWDTLAGHNSPLYKGNNTQETTNIASAFSYVTSTRGIPVSKLNLGIPFYGKKYPNTETIYSSPTTDTTTLNYNEILPMIGSGWTENYDTASKVPYLTKDTGAGLISYENPLSITEKVNYAFTNNFGGVFMWDLTGDYINGSQPLLQAMVNANNMWIYSH